MAQTDYVNCSHGTGFIASYWINLPIIPVLYVIKEINVWM